MMKSPLPALALSALGLSALALSGCVSLSDPSVLKSMSTVALVSVTSNSDIEWSEDKNEEDGESSGGLLKGVANLLSNEGKKVDPAASAILARADAVIEQAGKLLEEGLSSSGAVKAVAKEEVVGSDSYAGARDEPLVGVSSLKPQGYKFVQMNDKRLFSGLNAEIGSNGFIFASFEFEKTMMSGIGKSGAMTAKVILNITVVNAEGKVVFMDSYEAMGDANIPVVAGVYDPLVLAEDLKAATRNACVKFLAAIE